MSNTLDNKVKHLISSQMDSSLRLDGKVAVVTGAARGIGRASAVEMARCGADIIGIDICAVVDPKSGVTPSTVDDLDETGRLVDALGVRWQKFVLDTRDIDALNRAAESTYMLFERIDILFVNAGIQSVIPFLNMTEEDWHTTIDNNINGSARTIKAFAPYMVRNNYGRIIITASTQGLHGAKNISNYATSKWGLVGLTKSLALEFGEYGITVNALIPGLINTPLTRHETRYAQVLQEMNMTPRGMPYDEQKAIEILKATTPLGVPWLEPEDMAPMVVFLASKESGMASGACFSVTGGVSGNFMS